MIISFKFSIFDLEIEHKIIKELGEFTIFCMNAIHDNLTIEEISDIIKIKSKNIEKQLSFAISRGYLDSNFILTPKGITVVKLFEFVNEFNELKIKIALEHYIESVSKQIYLLNNGKFNDNQIGFLLEDNIFDYKLQNKFNEIIEDDNNKKKIFLSNNLSIYEDIIKIYLSEFAFKIKKNEKYLYYNYEIEDNEFINSLNDIKDKNNASVLIDIPILEINKKIESSIIDDKNINVVQNKLNQYKYFNLINGESIIVKKIKKDSNLTLEPIVEYKNILNKRTEIESLTIDELLFIDIKTDIKEFYETKSFDVTKIMDELCGI